MKIVIFDMDDLRNPHWGSGQAVVTREIGKRLSKNHQIEVYSSKYPGYEDYEEDGISYKHIGLGTNNPRINNIAYILSLPFTALRVKGDVIVEDFTAPISTLFSPVFTRIPVIGRGSCFAAEELSGKYNLPFYLVERFGVKFYKYFLCMNTGHKEKMERLNKDIKIRLIPNGVDSANFDKNDPEKNYILFIGRLDSRHKGLDMLLKAFALAKDKISDDLYIMGLGREEAQLKELAKKYKIDNRVKFLGKITGDAKNKYFTESKYTVFPSRYEGQSIASLEALSFGKPFIYFGIPGFDWMAEDSSIKVKPFNVEAYSEKMVELSNNKELRERLSQKARQFGRNFDWDVIAKKYEEFMIEAANSVRH